MLLKRSLNPSVLIFCVALIIRLPFVWIEPDDRIYNVDELTLAYSIVDRWLGLPSTTLYWPAPLLQFVGFLCLLPEMLWALMSDRSLDKLAEAIFAHYRDPFPIISVLRHFSAIAGAFTTVFLYQTVRYVSENVFAGVATAAVVTVLPLLVALSLTATADATAVMLTALAARLLFVPRIRFVLAGIAGAAAALTKVTMVPWLIILFLAAAVAVFLERGTREFLRASVSCVGAGIITAIVICPFLWIDPLRMAKALGGNVTAHSGGGLPETLYMSTVIEGRWIVVAALIAFATLTCVSLFNQRWRYPGLIIGLMLMALCAFYLTTGFGHWRYVVGALIPSSVLVAIALPRCKTSLLSAMATIAILVLGADSLSSELDKRRGSALPAMIRTAGERCTQGQTLWVQQDLLLVRASALPLSYALLEELAAYFERGRRSRAVAVWVESAGVSPRAASALQNAFDEHEQVWAARWKGLAAFSPSQSVCTVHLFRFDISNLEPAVDYIRGTFTLKTISDVRRALAEAGPEKVVTIIGTDKAVEASGLAKMPAYLDQYWAIASTLK